MESTRIRYSTITTPLETLHQNPKMSLSRNAVQHSTDLRQPSGHRTHSLDQHQAKSTRSSSPSTGDGCDVNGERTFHTQSSPVPGSPHQSLPPFPGSYNQILGSSQETKLSALAHVNNLTFQITKRISDLFRSEHGKVASKAEMLDYIDKYQEGSLKLLAAPSDPSDATHRAALRSDSGNHLTSDGEGTDNEDSESGESIEDSEEDALHLSTGLDEVDGEVRGQPSSVLTEQATPLQKSIVADTEAKPKVSGSRIQLLTTAPAMNTDSGFLSNEGASSVDVEVGASGVAHELSSNEAKPLVSWSEEKPKCWMVHNTLMVMQKEYEILNKSRKCSECKVKCRDTTFLPCGHFLMCKECSEPVYTCPTCFKDIMATAQTYLS